MNKLDFEGRVAVITGGAQGIGFAVAQRLVASGAKVCLWDVQQSQLDEARAQLGAAAQTVRVDVTSEREVSEAAKATRAAQGRIDVLVCSAGITGPNATLVDYPVDAWKQVFDVNVNGVFLCNRAVVPIMREGDYGRIVNIASVAGKEGNPNASAYSAAKAGVIALTKSLGKELAGYDIAVNCITPAAARTRIFDQMKQEHIDYMLSKIPRGRFLQVEEVAAMVAWLVSAENSFATGAVFDLSGGRATY